MYRSPTIATRLAIALAALIALGACASPSSLKGTDLGKTPAPDFKLVDQTGNAVSLADFRGKVVVLTFLYTHCPDECPLIASKLSTASASLGSPMTQTVYVAVSVDPANDTPIMIAKFVQDHNLTGKLRYLTGTPAQLQPVWTAYSLYVAPGSTDATGSPVSHSSRVIVIDKAGNQRVNFGSDFDTADLVSDVRALLSE
jgi:protein SCO1/2